MTNPAFDALQAWAYAVGAPYHLANEWPLDSLEPGTAEQRRHSADVLRQSWNDETAEALVSSMNWLGVEGHRRAHRLSVLRYSLMLRPAVAARREELRARAGTSGKARDELWQLNAVQADRGGVRASTMLGFDALRGVMLARHGWNLGWLTRQMFWDYVTDIARDVQRSYGSWAEMGQDFIVSRNYWRGTGAPDAQGEAVRRLLSDRESPWKRLPWRMPGLEVPRPPRASDARAPVWHLG